jgi:DNA-binding transcriptional regulator YiaG
MKTDWMEKLGLAPLAANPLASNRLLRLAGLDEPIDVKALRGRLGLSQQEFAARYGIPWPTLRQWERRRREPDTAARAYLTVIARDPLRVAAILRGASGDALIQASLGELSKALDLADIAEVAAAAAAPAAPAARKVRRSPPRSPARARARRASPAAPAASRNPRR